MSYQRIRQPRQFKRKMHILAGELRQRSTPSETILWNAIKDRQLGGRKFRRQVPIGGFVVDFYCAEEKLVVEIDGGIHVDQRAADVLRQEAIATLGIEFLRFTAHEVESDTEGVLMKIRARFKS